jgi:uncharacterized protein (TIGR03083 family)
MARPRNDHLWALAHAERAALAKDLAGLGAEQWRHDTLCGKWDVEQVVAHLTAAASRLPPAPVHWSPGRLSRS